MNPDFRDMLSEFCAADVEFLLVGAYALAVHGFPRATGDMDLWVRPSAANAVKVVTALARFGASLAGVGVADFEVPEVIFQIGVAPRRIDVITSIDGVDFDEAWATRTEADVAGLRIPVLSRDLLVRNKRATGRPKDLVDAQWLESAGERGREQTGEWRSP